MSLDPRPPFPHPLCYVLKLHRDSRPSIGRLQGVLEHVATGQVFPFLSASALQAALVVHASVIHARVATPDEYPED